MFGLWGPSHSAIFIESDIPDFMIFMSDHSSNKILNSKLIFTCSVYVSLCVQLKNKTIISNCEEFYCQFALLHIRLLPDNRAVNTSDTSQYTSIRL